MFACSGLSSSGRSSGKNLFSKAVAVSVSVLVYDPPSRVRVVGSDFLVNPILARFYIFHGNSLVL